MFLLDTDTLSELLKKHPSEKLLDHLEAHPADSFAMASISVMELRAGALGAAHPTTFWNRVDREIISHLKVLSFDHEAAIEAGNLFVHLQKKGEPIGSEDVMIAAIAKRFGAIVVTGNVRHFERVPGLRVENWIR